MKKNIEAKTNNGCKEIGQIFFKTLNFSRYFGAVMDPLAGCVFETPGVEHRDSTIEHRVIITWSFASIFKFSST